MLQALRKRTNRDEEGFTLIELMVVVLIIAILIAIAIPTFLGAQNRARDRAAQSNLRNAVTAAKTGATDHDGNFLNNAGTIMTEDATAGTGNLGDLEPAITFVAGTPAATQTVGVTTAAAGVSIYLVAKSGSGTFFGLKSTNNGLVTYCKGAAAPASTACNDPKW